MTKPIFVRAQNELLFCTRGRSWIDLLSGFGMVFLGHGHPRILAAVHV
jgi:acetylornithine/succinyldiaminopimelate/putrescine aminotransferase